jgi:hypothetical protein
VHDDEARPVAEGGCGHRRHFAMLDVAFEMSTPAAPDMWRRCLTMLLDGVRARDRPAMPGRVPVLNTLDDLVAVGKARRSRTADE